VTAEPLNELAEALLRTDEELSRGERELIAAWVSRGNECHYCTNSHLNSSLVHHGLPPRVLSPRDPEV
jgi:AhpD family alkylhydroperoxidase